MNCQPFSLRPRKVRRWNSGNRGRDDLYPSPYKPTILTFPLQYEWHKVGRRMERPHDCPESVYDVMRDCWSLKPADRPSWKMLVNALQSLYIGEEDKKISLARVYMNVNTVTFYLQKSKKTSTSRSPPSCPPPPRRASTFSGRGEPG